MQVELRDVINRRKLSIKHRPSDTLDTVRLESRSYQYLYSEGRQSTPDKARSETHDVWGYEVPRVRLLSCCI